MTIGEYQDRRNDDKIDCSKTIWVIATNALDASIRDFCQVNGATIWNGDDEVKQAKLMKTLSKDLKEGFLNHFSVSTSLSSYGSARQSTVQRLTITLA